MATRVLALSLMLAPVSAQPLSRYQDLAAELMAKVAAAIASAEPAFLSLSAIDDADQTTLGEVRAQMARELTTRGVRLTERAEGATIVRVSCLENLRERACVADIETGPTRRVIAATRPLDARADRPLPLSLDVQRLFSQRAPILDAALAGDRLVVLDPQFVTRYQRSDTGWQRVDAQPIVTMRIWPRDVRGRVRVDGARIEAFLPGVLCRSASDGSRLACADEGQPWPIGFDNMGIEANRNYFYTPEGLAFFGAAPLGPDADARWLVAGSTGALLLLDENRRAVATVGLGDDVAALNAPCAGSAGTVVLVASSGSGERPDTLRLFRALRRQLVPAAAPIDLPGRFTALWAAPDSRGPVAATAVSYDAAAERYEVFQIRIAC